MIKKLLKLASVLAIAVIALFVAALTFLVVQRNREVTLPAPAGPYPVGRILTTWTDESRLETLGGAPGQHRTLSVWIWYPAQEGGQAVPYMPPQWAEARQADRGIGALFFQAISSIQGHATDAGLASQGSRFPVLVFEPGLGLLIPEFTTLVEDLASRGYVVVGLNPTYSASITVLDGKLIPRSSLGNLPDNAPPEQLQKIGDDLVQVWAADDRFAIDQAILMNMDPSSPFAGRLDVDHIGLLGHSFGGAAALEACHLDSRCSAAADLDGSPFGSVVRAGLDQPALLVSSEDESNTFNTAMQKSGYDLADIFAKSHRSYQILIRGSRHFNFTDSSVEFVPLERLVGVIGSINGVRGLHIASVYLGAFFNQTLKSQPSPLLQGPSKDYPEVQIASH